MRSAQLLCSLPRAHSFVFVQQVLLLETAGASGFSAAMNSMWT
jgi:hypothetical protein